ncbi:MAG: primosomal protein N' [Gammaproteobacteria bacterium]|nr:primosomal protein N' [Gammaproteobacteria bacterium]
MTAKILKIAVPVPLYKCFDYLAPVECTGPIIAGTRVLVQFGNRQLVGIIISEQASSDVPVKKLKAVRQLLPHPLPSELLNFLQWAASYYQHPIGEALNHALPAILRQADQKQVLANLWQLTAVGFAQNPDELTRSPRQAELLRQLQLYKGGMDKAQLDLLSFNWRDSLRSLEKKQLVKRLTQSQASALIQCQPSIGCKPILNEQQQSAVASVAASLDHYQAFLLEGITGSGKTEVYLHLVEQVLLSNKQSLILVPEINLTPQLISRFKERFSVPIAVLHSGLNNSQRLLAWQQARDNQVNIIIGTRSALFTPLANPGLIIVDEEHDSSYKQQDNFRYQARDLALVRAKRLDIPLLMGSATPSLESLFNSQQGRYQRIKLTQRAGNANPPNIQLLDVRRKPMQEGLSDHLVELIRQTLEQKSQVLLFLNRRGYAPALLCHDCGWVMPCPRCDAKLTYHHQRTLMRCHHCGHETRPPKRCPECQCEELINIGIGTERLEKYLNSIFPDADISRIDSDTTSRKGSLDKKLADAHSGKSDILIGTQMLAKGHDFPHVTLVGILDVDGSLFSSDFRAPEFMAQQLIQVAGRAGRADKSGRVIIQTHHPEHPLLQTLLHHGYPAFAKEALEERQQACFPPYSSLALLRAEATQAYLPVQFLEQAFERFSPCQPKIELFGPFPSPMERRAGRYRYQLLIQATSRAALQQCLNKVIPHLNDLAGANKVRWSIDIDPQSML